MPLLSLNTEQRINLELLCGQQRGDVRLVSSLLRIITTLRLAEDEKKSVNFRIENEAYRFDPPKRRTAEGFPRRNGRCHALKSAARKLRQVHRHRSALARSRSRAIEESHLLSHGYYLVRPHLRQRHCQQRAVAERCIRNDSKSTEHANGWRHRVGLGQASIGKPLH